MVFLAGRSTENSCLNMMNFIHQCIDSKKFVIGIFFDLSCAFDSINHSFLRDKLDYLGIRGINNDLIPSYVKSRVSMVKIGNSHSHKYVFDLGVLQAQF